MAALASISMGLPGATMPRLRSKTFRVSVGCLSGVNAQTDPNGMAPNDTGWATGAGGSLLQRSDGVWRIAHNGGTACMSHADNCATFGASASSSQEREESRHATAPTRWLLHASMRLRAILPIHIR